MKRLKACHFCKISYEDHDVDFRSCNCGLLICNTCYRKHCIRRDLECPRCENPLINLLKVHGPNRTANQDTWSYSSSDDEAAQSKADISQEDLANIRVIQRNLVYIIGLAPSIANEEDLRRAEHFGQYGKINKVVVNRNKAYNPNGKNGPSYSAYITFATERDAYNAIQAVDNFQFEGRTIRASYGTTKYCTYFLRNQACPNSECLYLHSLGNQDDCFTKEEINRNRLLIQEQLNLQEVKNRKPPTTKAKIKGSEPVFPVVSREILERNPYLKSKGESSRTTATAASTTTTIQKEKSTSIQANRGQSTAKIKAKNMLELFREELEQDDKTPDQHESDSNQGDGQEDKEEMSLTEALAVSNKHGSCTESTVGSDELLVDDCGRDGIGGLLSESDSLSAASTNSTSNGESSSQMSSSGCFGSSSGFQFNGFFQMSGDHFGLSAGPTISSTSATTTPAVLSGSTPEIPINNQGSPLNNANGPKRARSRFQFAQEKESSTIEVPDCIPDVISKSVRGKAIDSGNKEELEQYFTRNQDWDWLQKMIHTASSE